MQFLDLKGVKVFKDYVDENFVTTEEFDASEINVPQYLVRSDLEPYALKESPNLTGVPTAPTAATGTNTTQIATTAFVQNALPDVSNFITSSVNNLANYYLKSETYTKSEVQALIAAINQFSYMSAQTLPTASADTMYKIYLVPSADPQQLNVKDEFITIDNGSGASTRYTWEQIGSTAIDLSGYVTTEALNSALSAYQATLVSGTNIKTINNTSILGSGNIDIPSSTTSYTQTVTTGDTIGTVTKDGVSTDVKAGTVIYSLEDNGTTTAGTWLAKNNDITSLYDGLTVKYKITVAGDTTTTLKINNLAAKTVYRYNATKLSTEYSVGSYLILYYSASLNSGSWILYTSYDSNTNTYQRLYPTAENVEYPITTRYNTTSGNSYYAEYGRYSTGVTLNPSTNTITASAFKVTNGTSSQFLKADGSVDSNTYALSGDIPTDAVKYTSQSLTTTQQTQARTNIGAGTYSKPSTGIPAADLASSVQTSLGLADTALQSFTETDPTVPAWAKASTKPSYSYSEISGTPTIPVVESLTTTEIDTIWSGGTV